MRSLDADEYIGVDVVNNAIDGVFDIGESNEVHSKFEEFSENKKSMKEIVVAGCHDEMVALWMYYTNSPLEDRRTWDPGITVVRRNTLRTR